ncbi:MAG: aminotransferase class III-fold pyridoxal phosphate-dependent enzyme [Planctomycetota bacterium]
MKKKGPTQELLDQTRNLMSRGREVLAYGGLHSPIEDVLEYPGGALPQFVTHAKGCRIFDTCGQSYVDWFIGWGPMLLGYHHPEVDEAIIEQVRKGHNVSLMHPLEVEVAEQLKEMVPCAEKIAFGKNGSDVTCAAVRVARAITGRDGILSCGYHGFHDWYQALNPDCRGVPQVLKSEIASFPYNNLEALEDLLSRHHERIAAVIMEPTHDILPAPGYLEGVRELTRRFNVLLIFDEVVTGFRLAPGGAQELYGVIPDLACLGKALSNGLPLSALAGKAEYMSILPAVSFGITFRGEALSLAAAHACLKIFKRDPITKRLAETGEKVRASFHKTCAKWDLPWKLSGHPSRMNFHYSGGGRISAEGAKTLFFQECLKGGMLTRGVMLASYALDEEAVALTTKTLDQAMKTVSRALKSGRLEKFLHFPPAPHFYEA